MDYQKIIDENKVLQIEMLQDLVSIRSVVSDPVTAADGEIYPFGKGVQDAFVCFLNKAKAMGFETKDIDHYGGHIEFGQGKELVGILGHLDVVPEGSGWSFAPDSGAVSDGYIYGRGTLDNKGPMVAVLFAMKALKDAGYEPAKKVRLILGLDEETKWEGMDYYFAHAQMPDYGFTPDADFPAIHGEKGMMSFEIAKKLPKQTNTGLSLRSLSGGTAGNMVAEKARAVVNSDNPDTYPQIKELAAAFRGETGYKINTKGVGKSLEITAEGKAAHAAYPQDGCNAISIMMEFLGKLNFASDELNVFFDFYLKHIGFDVNGQHLGCGFSDPQSGKLTLNVGLVHYDKGAVSLHLNVRYPVTCTEEQVYEAILPVLNRYDMGLIKLSGKKPIYMEPDSPMIRTLVDIYRKHTGDQKSQSLVIGGGTYAKAAKHVVAFGALFPGDEDLMHQRDERLSIDRFMTMTKIYADAIYQLTQADFKQTEEV